MDSKGMVTIVTPAYNASKYISETIESVLNQSYDNWEMLIVNDGSTDNTKEIVESFSDKRIKLINQSNQGVSVARNKALDEAKGEYITFLDADDILPKKSLEVRVKFLEENLDVDLVDGYAVAVSSDLKDIIREHKPTYRGKLFPQIIKLDGSVYLTCYYMFRKNKLGNIRFKKGMTHSEDVLFFIMLAYYNDITYGAVKDKIFIYRVGHESAMKNIKGLEKGYIELIKEISKLNISPLFKTYLRLKISKIMVLTWISKREFLNAFKTTFYMIRA